MGTPLDFRVGFGAGINQTAKIVQIDRDYTQFWQKSCDGLGAGRAFGALLANPRRGRWASGGAAGQTGTVAKRTSRRRNQAAWQACATYMQSQTQPINHYQLASALGEALGAGPAEPVLSVTTQS